VAQELLVTHCSDFTLECLQELLVTVGVSFATPAHPAYKKFVSICEHLQTLVHQQPGGKLHDPKLAKEQGQFYLEMKPRTRFRIMDCLDK
jgi:hypothetical protein